MRESFFCGKHSCSSSPLPLLFVNSISFSIMYLADLSLSIQVCICMTVDDIINPIGVQSRYSMRRNLTAITSFKRLYKSDNVDIRVGLHSPLPIHCVADISMATVYINDQSKCNQSNHWCKIRPSLILDTSATCVESVILNTCVDDSSNWPVDICFQDDIVLSD